MARLLAIMGSGETAPTMVKPHRQLFEQLDPDPGPAVLLDTPYGFQENADDISARAVEYFAASVGRTVEPVELRRVEGADPVRTEAALARLAGPAGCSPGRAARPTPCASGPAPTCPTCWPTSSPTAAAWSSPAPPPSPWAATPCRCTRCTRWAPTRCGWTGLDLLGELGPDLAVIPHYDNAEGGTHDTRFCYLGERRLAMLEAQLPETGWVLGVDEHTACVFDLDAGTASVVGNGVVTVRRAGVSSVVASGETLPMAALVDLAFGKEGPGRRLPAPAGPVGRVLRRPPCTPRSAGWKPSSTRPWTARDIEAAVRAVLELEDTLEAWSGDTTQSDAGERGRAARAAHDRSPRASWPAPGPGNRGRWSAATSTPCWRSGRRPGRTGVLGTPTGSGTCWSSWGWRSGILATGPSGRWRRGRVKAGRALAARRGGGRIGSGRAPRGAGGSPAACATSAGPWHAILWCFWTSLLRGLARL